MEPDLTETRRAAEEAARVWGVELGEPFHLSRYSYVAPAGGDAVVKVAWEGDEESLHEAEALELWDGDGAVRLLARHGRALLEERVIPGDDISDLDQDDAMRVAVEVGHRLWRRAGAPFRPITDHVPRWLANSPTSLTDRARDLYSSLEVGDWLVHGDFHHHNVLRQGSGFVAIDPKPYLADREYDVYSWLHNPIPYELERRDVERRIAHFVAGGLDEHKVRAWSLIRAAYLMDDPRELAVMGSLLD